MKKEQHSLKPKTMNIIAYFLSIIFCFTQAGGCVGLIGETTEEKTPKLDVTYELPTPWKIDQEDGSAILGQPTHTGHSWFVKIEPIIWHRGNDGDAYKEALQEKQDTQTDFTEQKIDGTKVYLFQGQSDGEFDGKYTTMYFSRDGWVVGVTIFDAYEYHKEALEQLVRTYKIREIK